MNSENGTRFVLHRCHAAADPTRRLIRQPLKVCRITLLATVVVLMTRPAAGQDNWLEQWTLHATDEGADIHQERMLSPSQNDERELTDNITRSDSGFARVRPEFDLADFTTDFAESPRNTEHLTRFRQEESEGSESTADPRGSGNRRHQN